MIQSVKHESDSNEATNGYRIKRCGKRLIMCRGFSRLSQAFSTTRRGFLATPKPSAYLSYLTANKNKGTMEPSRGSTRRSSFLERKLGEGLFEHP